MANRVGGGFLKDFIYMFTVIRPSIPRITLPMSLQPRNYVVLIHHSIYSLTLCLVGKHVTYVRIQKIQIDGGRPNCVDQLHRSRTKLRTSNTSLRSVLLEMMYWQKKYVDDVLAEEVPSRVVGSVFDLHAAEARYHRDCMCRFFANRLLSTGNEGGPLSPRSQYQPDMTWKHMVTTLSNDQKRVWNTVELQQEYQDHGGVDLTRSQLADNQCNHFEGIYI